MHLEDFSASVWALIISIAFKSLSYLEFCVVFFNRKYLKEMAAVVCFIRLSSHGLEKKI